MDTQEQIFGLVENAQQQQAAVNEALTRLSRVTEEFTRASNAAVSAIEATTKAAALTGIMRASERAFEMVADAVNPLFVALKAVGVTADDAAKGYRQAAIGIHVRWGAVAGGMAACCIAAVLITAWVSLTWQRNQVGNLKEERAALLVEVADLRATADKLTARGGLATLNMCGPQKGRVCVRVDAGAGTFGEKDKSTYYVVYGY